MQKHLTRELIMRINKHMYIALAHSPHLCEFSIRNLDSVREIMLVFDLIWNNVCMPSYTATHPMADRNYSLDLRPEIRRKQMRVCAWKRDFRYDYERT